MLATFAIKNPGIYCVLEGSFLTCDPAPLRMKRRWTEQSTPSTPRTPPNCRSFLRLSQLEGQQSEGQSIRHTQWVYGLFFHTDGFPSMTFPRSLHPTTTHDESARMPV